MMYCTQFVEAFVRDRERELLAAAARARPARDGRKSRVSRQGRRVQADTMARQLAEGEGRASADRTCRTPAAA